MEISRMILIGVIVLMAFVTVASAYGGYANPSVLPAAALIAMIFPGMVLLDIATAVILIFTSRKLAVVLGVALLLSLPSILIYSPVNFHRALTPKEKERSFTLMTYNTYYYGDYTNAGLDTIEPNRTVELILKENPDILVMQEAVRIKEWDKHGITRAQADSIDRRYPYFFYEPKYDQMLYSKFPVMRVVADERLSNSATMISYRFAIEGRLLTLYNVHLQSIGLTPEDKTLYKELTSGSASGAELQQVRNTLFAKLYSAFRQRAFQARMIRDLVESKSGNVIVCGDFNDVPGCYAIRTIMGHDMHDAFVDAGMGPSISYRAGRFYFRIDQTLYRGDFRAVDSRRVAAGLSDHYPILTTFVWDEPSPIKQPLNTQ